MYFVEEPTNDNEINGRWSCTLLTLALIFKLDGIWASQVWPICSKVVGPEISNGGLSCGEKLGVIIYERGDCDASNQLSRAFCWRYLYTVHGSYEIRDVDEPRGKVV